MESGKQKENVSWKEASTLEEWVEKMLREGYTEIVQSMMKALPESSKERYREMYRRIRSEEKK